MPNPVHKPCHVVQACQECTAIQFVGLDLLCDSCFEKAFGYHFGPDGPGGQPTELPEADCD